MNAAVVFRTSPASALSASVVSGSSLSVLESVLAASGAVDCAIVSSRMTSEWPVVRFGVERHSLEFDLSAASSVSVGVATSASLCVTFGWVSGTASSSLSAALWADCLFEGLPDVWTTDAG